MDFNRELLYRINQMGDKSCSVGELAQAMRITSKNAKKRLNQSIRGLLRRGLIVGRGKNKVARCPKALVKGVLQGNRKGFAFLIREDNKKDIFIPSSMLNGAMHGDTVLAACGRGDEGAVVKILKRGITNLVGTFIQSGKNGYVIPDMQRYISDIFIPVDLINSASHMSKVVVNITVDKAQQPFGEVIQVLGKIGERKTEILSILRGYGFNQDFPQKVIAEAERLNFILEKRKDFTDLLTITIDGEDAKDFDDAVSLEKTKTGYKLYVHIADVSHYVKVGSQIDKEAFKRGTSVYSPEEVYPMLPEKISCELCSLRPNEKKMAISVVLNIDNRGKVQQVDIYETIICSNYRMTYENITKILEGDKQLREKYHDIIEMLEYASELADLLLRMRKKAGMINFISSECKIDLDKNGEVISISRQPETMSHNIIEQFMIAANEAVASFIDKKNIPNVYRSHEKISQEKLVDFVQFIKSLGYDIDLSDGVKPKAFSNLLNNIKGDKAEQIINNRADKRFIERQKGWCEKASVQSTEREIAAVSAERDIDEYYKALYMEKFIGHKFNGTISGVIAMGIFVGLENTVEGFVSVEQLPLDKYEFDEKNYCLRGKKYIFTLTDEIEIEVIASNPVLRRVDMALTKDSLDNFLI